MQIAIAKGRATRPDIEPLPFHDDGFFQAVHDSLGDHGGPGLVDARQENPELIAAEASDRVGRPHRV